MRARRRTRQSRATLHGARPHDRNVAFVPFALEEGPCARIVDGFGLGQHDSLSRLGVSIRNLPVLGSFALPQERKINTLSRSAISSMSVSDAGEHQAARSYGDAQAARFQNSETEHATGLPVGGSADELTSELACGERL